MMKKKSLFFASLNIWFPPATTTAVDRTTGVLKNEKDWDFDQSLPEKYPNKAKVPAVL